MHELAIAQSLLDIVEDEARAHNGVRVTKIRLRIGKLSSVVPDALRGAFEMLTRGGIAEDASLEIEEVPVSIRCHQCAEAFSTEEPFLVCPSCEGSDVELVAGRELELQSMEIEDGNKAG